MEQESQHTDSAEIIELVDIVEDDLSSESHVLCCPDRRDRRRLGYALLASLLFHVGVYSVLSYAAVAYPVVAASSDQETLWFYPSLLLASPPVSENASRSITAAAQEGTRQQATPTATDAGEEPQLEVQRGASDDGIQIYTPQVSPTVQNIPAQQSIRRISRLRKVESEILSPEQPRIARLEKSEPQSAETVPPEQPVESLSSPLPAEIKPEQVPLKESLKVTPVERSVDDTRVNTIVKEPAAAVTPVAAEATRVEPARVVPVRVPLQEPAVAAVKNTIPTVPGPKTSIKPKRAAAVRMAGTPSAPTPTARAVSASAVSTSGTKQKTAPAARAATTPASRTSLRPDSEKSADKREVVPEKKTQALLMPPIPGDLKFEITSDESIQRGVKMVVLFREFPKSRRSRPLSKSETSRSRRIPSNVVSTRPTTLQAIVESAAEGVYYLRVELERQDSIEAFVTIRLHEPGPRTRIKSLGKLAITNNVTIVRVLMPEGILWEDTTAFSGSLDDSDSTTKYNNDSGLVWKEFN